MKNVAASSRARKLPAPPLSRLRSAISNGSALFLEDFDRRGAWARRLQDLIADHTNDLGGIEAVSTAEQVLIRRAAMLCLQCELLEQRFAQDEHGEASAKAFDMYQRATNTLRRTLESLGLQRRQKDVTPSLSRYLKSKNGHDEFEDADT
jgi:hypothetical protein